MDARTQIRSIFRNMLRIEDAADGRLPPQGTPGGVSKQALRPEISRFCIALSSVDFRGPPRPRSGYRRHRTEHAYGCFLPDLTRFTVNPCIGPDHGRGVRARQI